MLDLGTLRINITADSSAAKKNLTDVQQATEQVEKSTKNSTNTMSESWKSFSGTVKTAAVAGVAALVGGVASLVSVASETSGEMGKLETAFNTVGYSTETAQSTFKGFVGLLGETDTAVEASNHLAKLCDNEEQLSQWTNIAAGVFATFGDSLPLESLTEAANETAKTGVVVGSMADALNWAGVSEDDFNQKLAACNDEAERSQLVTDTLNGIYSETGQTYRDNNSALIEYNESQAQLQKALSDLGTALMPVVTKVQDFASGLLEQAKPAIEGLVSSLPQVKQSLTDLLPLITGVVAGFVTFKAAMAVSSIISTAIGLFNTMRTALQGVSVAQALLNAVMSANPIVLVVTLIAGLVAAIITLWNTNEGFREAVTNAWNAISSTASAVWGAIVQFFTVTVPQAIQSCLDWFAQLPGNIANFLSNALASVASWASGLASQAISAGQNFLNGIQNKFNEVVNFFVGLPGRILSALGDLGSLLWDAGSSIIDGLLSGLKSAWDGVVGWFSDITSAIPNLKGPIEVDAKLLVGNGETIMAGLLDGLKDGWKDVQGYLHSRTASVSASFGMSDSEANYRAFVRTTASKAAIGNVTNNNYYIGDTSVSTMTEQQFAQDFIALMTRYGRLAAT